MGVPAWRARARSRGALRHFPAPETDRLSGGWMAGRRDRRAQIVAGICGVGTDRLSRFGGERRESTDSGLIAPLAHQPVLNGDETGHRTK